MLRESTLFRHLYFVCSFSNVHSKGLGFAEHPHAYWLKKLLGFSIVCMLLISFTILTFRISGLILFLNFFSIRRVVAPFQMISSFAKLIACTFVIGLGAFQFFMRGTLSIGIFQLFYVTGSKFKNFDDLFVNSTYSPGQISAALLGGFYSYDGWDILNWGAEEIRNPRKYVF